MAEKTSDMLLSSHAALRSFSYLSAIRVISSESDSYVASQWFSIGSIRVHMDTNHVG
jgi:hypothetical protein